MRSLLSFSLLGISATEPTSAPTVPVTATVDGFDADMRDAMEASSEKHEFQAEVNRLMDIIINSLYSDKSVFLRELISNAADALEKVRFMSVQDETILGETKDLDIKIEFDEGAKTLSIMDTGLGMTKSELINNLGTVAKSGTTNFLEGMKEGSDATNFIGQFGVGFYSAFLVADKVTVTSKNHEEADQHVWESAADASFSIATDPRGATLGRGTRVTMHLKEDALEFMSEGRLKDLATKHSQFIQFPIYVKIKKEVEAEVEDDDDSEDDSVEVEEDEDKESEKKMAKQIVHEWQQVNTQKAIWMRNKDEISKQEYNDFYKSLTKDGSQDPLAHTHFNAEGEIEFASILYVPKKAPFDMMDNYHTKKSQIKLFVRRVLVADDVEELMPKYLNFMRGVVDADDLPLNVSREQLQQNKIMKIIAKKLVRKTLELLKKLAKPEDPEKEKDGEEPVEKSEYDQFYQEFGKNLKMGCIEDDANRSKVAKLLRFHSTKSDAKLIFLDEYLDRMQEKQDTIYFLSGDSLDVMNKSPALQMFKKKDIEVLLLDDQLDESCFQKLADYEGKKFVSIQKADMKIDESDDEKKLFDRKKKHFQPLTEWMKDTLVDLTENGEMKDTGVKVDKVELSKRLVDSPCVVVSGQFGYSAQQEKAMRAHSFQNKEMMAMMIGRKTLEINANHPVIQDLLEKVKADKEDPKAKESASVLFQSALLESGYEITDPTSYVKRVYTMMSNVLGVDPNAPMREIDLPEESIEKENTHAEEEEEEEIADEEADSGVEEKEEL